MTIPSIIGNHQYRHIHNHQQVLAAFAPLSHLPHVKHPHSRLQFYLHMFLHFKNPEFTQHRLIGYRLLLMDNGQIELLRPRRPVRKPGRRARRQVLVPRSVAGGILIALNY
jgi:hypothetical protein